MYKIISKNGYSCVEYKGVELKGISCIEIEVTGRTVFAKIQFWDPEIYPEIKDENVVQNHKC